MVLDRFTNAFIHALLKSHSDNQGDSVLSLLLAKSPKYLHVIIDGDDAQMLQLAKQIALLAHFPTFKEEDPNTCTIITLLGSGKDVDWKSAFGNLCIVNAFADKLLNDWIKVPIDIRIEHDILSDMTAADWAKDHVDPNRVQVLFDKHNIASSEEGTDFLLDEHGEMLAKRVNAIYDESQRFDIIRAEDIEHVHEFDVPVEQFVQLSDLLVDEAWQNENTDKDSSRAMAISMFVRIEMLKCLKTNKDHSLYDTLTRHLPTMSCSEHARWNVEKLINGFRPYTKMEVIEDENLCGDTRTSRVNYLKKNDAIRAHLDLCSYSRLRRIDLKSIKYDSFLLLAMVKYWEQNINI